jgi:hypothetical protein
LKRFTTVNDGDQISPLEIAGIKVNEGDYLISINGKGIERYRKPAYGWNKLPIEKYILASNGFRNQ